MVFMLKAIFAKFLKILCSFIVSMSIVAISPVTVAGELTNEDVIQIQMEEVVQVNPLDI